MSYNDQQNFTPIRSVNAVYKKIAAIFIILIIVSLSVILYFSLSKAEIYLSTKNQSAKTNFSIQVKENTPDKDYLKTNILSGRILELTVEKTKEFEVKGKPEISGKYSGMMTIINEKSQSQPLVKTTRFESQNGKIFRIQSNVVVPANGSIKTYVIADGDGEDYNEAPGKFTIPGLNEASRKLVYGNLEEAMKRDSNLKYILSQEDLDNAQKDLENELKTSGIIKLKELLTSDETLSDEDINTETISNESSKKIDEETQKFEYTLKLKIIGIVFNKEELLMLAQNNLKKQLDKSQELVDFDNNSLKYSISNYVEQEKSATIEAELSAKIKQSDQSENFNPERFKGLTQEDIIDYFSNVPGIDSVRVNFSPFWVKKAPKFSNHIKIIIE